MLAPQELRDSCEQGLKGEEAQKIVSAIFQHIYFLSYSVNSRRGEAMSALLTINPQIVVPSLIHGTYKAQTERYD